MLFELYQYLTTPCPRPVKDMGYLKEMIGMAARQRRCRAAWQPHLDRCRDWVVQAMEDCENRGRVMVLGSGLLNDVPLEELSRGFETVVLVDILHMPAVRKAAGRFPNVELEETDITRFVAPLYRHLKDGGPLPVPDRSDIPDEDSDLVISLNILSQLPVPLSEYAEKMNMPLGQDIAAGLVAAHLEALAGCSGRVCLITEVEHRLCEGDEVIERTDPLAGVSIPASLKVRSAGWDWRFAPHPERHRRYDLVYRVEGYAN